MKYATRSFEPVAYFELEQGLDDLVSQADGYAQRLVNPVLSVEDGHQGEICFHLHLHLFRELVTADTQDLCAVFQRDDSTHIELERLWRVRSKLKAPHRRQRRHGIDGLMFVYAIQLVDEPKSVIPCLMRLHALNRCPHRGIDIGGQSLSLTLKPQFVLGDGEKHIAPVEGVLFIQTENPEQMVKTGDDVLARISRNQRPRGRSRLIQLDAEGVMRHIRVTYRMHNEMIGITLGESLHRLTESVEVLLSTPEFEAGAVHGNRQLSPASQSETGSNEP